MKKIILIFVLLCFYQISEAQTFQFQMFFEDAIGNKDTLTIGYDFNGTELIDSSFGEENIIGIPLDSTFDVRISDAFYHFGNATFHTKKQILPNLCAGGWFPIVAIDIKCENWPVVATWDNSLFYNECREGSVFTSINPGGWWDTGSPSDLYRAELTSLNQVTFMSNYDPFWEVNENYAYINSSNDTIPYFWMAFGDLSLITLGVENISADFKLYPNPVKDLLYIDTSAEFVKEVILVDMVGRRKNVEFKNGSIDLRSFKSGYYQVIINGNDGESKNMKVLKE
ncbi:T9SS type A sorting domain-containing protein [Brumimicrobium oceani]|uniref:Secretion system C-terminal sorting domain-containing protein n=1 Tax=Brumimicrobium oceani TaxID=2100725 RepID=A0A2U2XD67_9FLAO|nr:T9SS type A sorting domain-containing protein [Brumimicrobium oceani]PWH85749.1 hypothetical protein DIT68_06555 [Brumimicrobium oceani]